MGEFISYILEQLMGTTARQGAEIVIDRLKLPLKPEEFMKMADEEYLKVFPMVQFLPGVERLLDHLRDHKVPMAIASSSKRISFELKTKKFGEKFQPGHYFHHILLASDDPEVKQGKPAPDTFLICRTRFDPVPSIADCLVFEDSVSGAIAGCRAGMQTVMIPDPRLDVEEAIKQNEDLKPCLILPSMLDFKPEVFGLPSMSS